MSYHNINKHDKKRCLSKWTPKTKSVYKRLKCLEKKLKDECLTWITNDDFKHGTLILDKPGHYRLCEDIVFHPNPKDNFRPRKDQSQYQTRGFSLGFFSAICITANDVLLDMNGYSIRQSKAFYLQQRFYSHIELANTPFIKGQGPLRNNLPDQNLCAESIIIKNGRFGLSSHHCIHGNLNKNILLKDLCLEDFEIAAIALNGSDGVIMRDLFVGPNKHNVPVLGTYSAAIFATMFAKEVLDNNTLPSNLADELLIAYNRLKKDSNKALHEWLRKGKVSNPLFKNQTGLPDGNAYGILLHVPGVAVNDLIQETEGIDYTEGVLLDRVCINGIKVRVNEIIGLSQNDGTSVQNDVSGSIFQIEKVTKEGKYHGNSLSALQLLLAEAGFVLNKTIGKSNITQDLITWAKQGNNISVLLDQGYKYKCNTDTMFHLNKGLMTVRADAAKDLTLYKCQIHGSKNYGRLGNEKLGGKYSLSHDSQVLPGYTGADTNALVLSCCSQVRILKNDICNTVAKNGDCTGVRIINGSDDVLLDHLTINGVYAGRKVKKCKCEWHGGKCKCEKKGKKCKCEKKYIWLGEDYYGHDVKYTDSLPNGIPNAYGVFVSADSSNICIKHDDICNICAPGKAKYIYYEK